MKETEKNTFHVLENVIFLKKSALFSSMKTSELRAIATIAQELQFVDTKEIVRENDVGDSLYLIKEGSVAIKKVIDETESIHLATLAQGECFGEMALFDTEVRSASVYAQGSCTLLCIQREELFDLLIDFPTIATEFLKIFIKRLRSANKKVESMALNGKEK